MRKLHTYIYICLIAVLSSCEGWLHVTPKTQVPTEDFFVRIDKEINELLANASKVDLTVHFGEDV